MSEQVYIQIKNYTHSTSHAIHIKDVCSLQCADTSVSNRLNSLCIYKFPKGEKRRVVLSSIYVIAQLQDALPNVEIVPLGATDIIVKYEPHPSNNKVLELIKVACICVITFIGAGFSIIAFNSDVDANAIFALLQEKLNINDTTNFAILELAYSFGLAVGIMVFYNHFGNKKFSCDPTPLEIEMRMYENEINQTIIDGDNREVNN